MRKNKMIKLVAGGAICALSFAVAAAVPMAKDIASADDYTLEMVGAAIRPDENYGIRFTAQTSAVRDGSKYYVMIVPNSWLSDTNYLGDCIDGDYYKHLTVEKELKEDDPTTPEYDGQFITMEATPKYQESGEYAGKWLINGTISNVHFSNTNNQFFGVAYEVLADGQTRVYAESQDKSVRSICYVAGAALNDESANYSDTMKTKLRDTVNDAYDFVTNGEETGATLDLSSFGFKQTGGYYTLDKGSVTPLEMTGLPTIDLPIEYSVSAGDGAPSTITEEGVLTVNDETGYSFVKAQIAGETRNLTVRNTPQMAEGMLNDFASGSDGNTRTYDMNVYGTDVTGGRGVWLSEKADAYGNMGYGVGSVAKGSEACGLRFNVSKAELKAMDIDTITVRFLVEVADTSVKNLSLNFFWTADIANPGSIYKNYPVNTWSYYTINKTTDASAWETFIDTYCNTGVGRTAWNMGGFQLYSGTATLYIDYISVGTQRMAEHELENFNVSSGEISNSIISVMSFTNLNGNNSTLLETQADEDGVTALKVAKLTIKADAYGIAVMRFARTAEELTAILETLESMTWRVMVNKDQTLSILGNAIPLTANKWTEVTLTKAQLLANFTGTTEAEKIATFASYFCSTGTALVTPRMFSVPSADCPVDLYVDGVTYTATTAE